MLADLLAPIERLQHHRAGPDGEIEGDEIALAPPGLTTAAPAPGERIPRTTPPLAIAPLNT